MAYYSGFQRNAYQRNAFQIKTGGVVTPDITGGGFIYQTATDRHKEEQYQHSKIAQHREELQRVDDELADAARKQQEIADNLSKRQAKKAAKQLAALEASLQGEINRLRIERVWLMQRIDDEESILILMLVRRRRCLI